MAEEGVNSTDVGVVHVPRGESSGTDLYLELAGTGSRRGRLMDALRDAVRSGRLAPGTRLPPYRSLAADLGVARNTVSAAYAELSEEGWLTARQGSGTWVAERHASLQPAERPSRLRRPETPRIKHDLMPSSPDAAAFPRSAWLASVRAAVAAAPTEAFGVGDPRGRVELRVALTEYLARARGVRTEPERIVICAGFAHALRLLGRVLDGTVATEAYGLGFHREILETHGLRTTPVAVDAMGARVDQLPAEAGAVLLTPAHQFPIGGPLHPDRRAAVVNWARRNGGLVIEDDYDGEFRYDRQPVGAVQGLDGDHVVYVGSTSKSLSPALRIGWMVLPAPLVEEVLAVKGPRELWSGVVDQLTLADFIARGRYDAHLRRMRQHYRRRRDLLTAVIAARAPHVAVSGVSAGLHAVLELPEGTEAETLRAAERIGLAVDGLHDYHHPASPTRPRDGLVVGYGTPADHAFGACLEALVSVLPGPGRSGGEPGVDAGEQARPGRRGGP